MTNQTIEADYFEFSLGGPTDGKPNSHVGLHLIHGDTRTTVALPVGDAEVIARLLQAHVDYALGRPPRQWGNGE